MRRFTALVPALCSFGPLIMVIGYETPYHLVSLVASLVTSVGILIIFATVMQGIKERDSSENPSRETVPPANPATIIAVILGLAILAVAAITSVFNVHH